MKTHPNIKHKESLNFGEKIAKYITEKIGTFNCAILFCIIAFVSLPSVVASHNALIIVAWVAQTFLQLVLLPIIIVGQNLQSRHSEYIADATYENDVDMHKHLDRVENIVTVILNKLE